MLLRSRMRTMCDASPHDVDDGPTRYLHDREGRLPSRSHAEVSTTANVVHRCQGWRRWGGRCTARAPVQPPRLRSTFVERSGQAGGVAGRAKDVSHSHLLGLQPLSH